jgi:hypothetical protein
MSDFMRWRSFVVALYFFPSTIAAQTTKTIDDPVVSRPSPGAVVDISAGETLWTAETTPIATTVTRRIKLAKKITIGDFMHGVVSIPADSVFWRQPSDRGTVACTRLNMAFGRNKPCLIDNDSDGNFEAVLFKAGGPPDKLKEPAAYTVEVAAGSSKAGPSFRSVLIYLGSDGSAMSLSYREFTNDMARPAFTEELKVPLNKTYPQELRVKGVHFRILKLDGMGLQYVVVRPAA